MGRMVGDHRQPTDMLAPIGQPVRVIVGRDFRVEVPQESGCVAMFHANFSHLR